MIFCFSFFSCFILTKGYSQILGQKIIKVSSDPIDPNGEPEPGCIYFPWEIKGTVYVAPSPECFENFNLGDPVFDLDDYNIPLMGVGIVDIHEWGGTPNFVSKELIGTGVLPSQFVLVNSTSNLYKAEVSINLDLLGHGYCTQIAQNPEDPSNGETLHYAAGLLDESFDQCYDFNSCLWSHIPFVTMNLGSCLYDESGTIYCCSLGPTNGEIPNQNFVGNLDTNISNYFEKASSLESNNFNGINVFPNPFSENLNVILKNEIDMGRIDITMFNSTGKWIATFDMGPNEKNKKLDLSRLKLVPGLYFLKIETLENVDVFKVLRK